MKATVIMLIITLIFASPFIILNVILNKVKINRENKRLQENIKKAIKNKE